MGFTVSYVVSDSVGSVCHKAQGGGKKFAEVFLQ